jgi:hypothetical protein
MSNDSSTPDPIAELFGEPPLIKGEDKQRYLRLRAAVTHSVEPKTVYDWMLVNDTTNKYWEELRFRRMAAALIDGAYLEALEQLLRSFVDGLDIPLAVAQAYYCGDKETKKRTASRIAAYGITEDHIQAKAVEIIGGSLLTVDRMITSREASRRKLRKENRRRFENEDFIPGYVSDVGKGANGGA